MRSLTVTGRLGSDAKVEVTKNGNQFIKFAIASQEYNETEPIWFNIVSYNDNLVKMVNYYKKGTALIIQGKMGISKYTNKEGVLCTSHEITAYNIEFNGSNTKENSDTTTTTTTVETISPNDMTTTPKTKTSTTPKAKTPVDVINADIIDDLPF